MRCFKRSENGYFSKRTIKTKGTKCSLSKILLKIIYFLLKYFYTYLLCACMCLCMRVLMCHFRSVAVRGHLAGTSSFLLPCGIWILNSGHQPWSSFTRVAIYLTQITSFLCTACQSGFLSLFVIISCWNDIENTNENSQGNTQLSWTFHHSKT